MAADTRLAKAYHTLRLGILLDPSNCEENEHNRQLIFKNMNLLIDITRGHEFVLPIFHCGQDFLLCEGANSFSPMLVRVFVVGAVKSLIPVVKKYETCMSCRNS